MDTNNAASGTSGSLAEEEEVVDTMQLNSKTKKKHPKNKKNDKKLEEDASSASTKDDALLREKELEKTKKKKKVPDNGAALEDADDENSSAPKKALSKKEKQNAKAAKLRNHSNEPVPTVPVADSEATSTTQVAKTAEVLEEIQEQKHKPSKKEKKAAMLAQQFVETIADEEKIEKEENGEQKIAQSVTPKSDSKKHKELEVGRLSGKGWRRLDANRILVEKGFVPNMRTEGIVFATAELMELLLRELQHGGGGMQPSLQQVANVAGLPGIVGRSLAMPDIHCGYGFPIGGVCAMDTSDPEAVVSPGGVGFDINCGVRLVRTNLTEEEVFPRREELANALFHAIPVGAGVGGGITLDAKELKAMMTQGMKYLVKCGLVWPEDMEHFEENGFLPWADISHVSARAIKRGETQVGTMGAGNHYCEVQVIDEIFNPVAATAMGLHHVGQVVVMIHSGSRGLGHQVCTDYVAKLDALQKQHTFKLNDRQLACAKINSPEGKAYLGAMGAAGNFAFCNRSILAARAREAFHTVFKKSPQKMDMHVVYDVCHNIAKFEDHVVDGETKRLLVHRKGATRSFPPGHPEIPKCYREIGQPVLIGGSMGTCSYVLTGGEHSMTESFGSTCHGAGREMSRTEALRSFTSREVKTTMMNNGIFVRAGDSKLLAEEAAGAYKNVTTVVETCHNAGLSKLCVRLRPIAVIKG